MTPQNHFEKYQPKFRQEAWLKSFLSALTVGAAITFAVALITWFMPANGLWISLATLVVSIAVAMPLYYAKKYKPTVMMGARRLDSMGLEERMITMVEFEENDSCMAEIQRRDAQRVLSEVELSQVHLKVARKMIAIAVVLAVVAAAMTTVTALSTYGFVKSGGQLLEELLPDEPDVYYTVTYIIEEGGYFEGDEIQLVLSGESADPILVIAEDGYAFVEWDDGNPDPAREDMGVTRDLTFTAVFAPLDAEMDGDGDGSDSGEAMDGEPGKGEGDGDSPEGDESQDGDGEQPGDSGGGKYEEWNQIINGETYYREFLEAYKERLLEQLEKHGDELTEDERAIIEAYINLV